MTAGIRSLIGLASFRPVQTFQCSTPIRIARREPKSSFGENQLLPGSISFSLLTTGHPNALNDELVRASTPPSRGFTLPMASSPGFGSNVYDNHAKHDIRSFKTRFPYGSRGLLFCQATYINSLAHSSIGTPSPRFESGL